MKSNLTSIGFGGKLFIGDSSTCDEVNKIGAVYINVDENLNCAEIINNEHYDFKLPNPYAKDYGNNAKRTLKNAVEEAVCSLDQGKQVVIHSVNPELSIFVSACILFKCDSYDTFDDALYFVTKKRGSGKIHEKLIRAGQETFNVIE